MISLLSSSPAISKETKDGLVGKIQNKLSDCLRNVDSSQQPSVNAISLGACLSYEDPFSKVKQLSGQSENAFCSNFNTEEFAKLLLERSYGDMALAFAQNLAITRDLKGNLDLVMKEICNPLQGTVYACSPSSTQTMRDYLAKNRSQWAPVPESSKNEISYLISRKVAHLNDILKQIQVPIINGKPKLRPIDLSLIAKYDSLFDETLKAPEAAYFFTDAIAGKMGSLRDLKKDLKKKNDKIYTFPLHATDFTKGDIASAQSQILNGLRNSIQDLNAASIHVQAMNRASIAQKQDWGSVAADVIYAEPMAVGKLMKDYPGCLFTPGKSMCTFIQKGFAHMISDAANKQGLYDGVTNTLGDVGWASLATSLGSRFIPLLAAGAEVTGAGLALLGPGLLVSALHDRDVADRQQRDANSLAARAPNVVGVYQPVRDAEKAQRDANVELGVYSLASYLSAGSAVNTVKAITRSWKLAKELDGPLLNRFISALAKSNASVRNEMEEGYLDLKDSQIARKVIWEFLKCPLKATSCQQAALRLGSQLVPPQFQMNALKASLKTKGLSIEEIQQGAQNIMHAAKQSPELLGPRLKEFTSYLWTLSSDQAGQTFKTLTDSKVCAAAIKEFLNCKEDKACRMIVLKKFEKIEKISLTEDEKKNIFHRIVTNTTKDSPIEKKVAALMKWSAIFFREHANLIKEIHSEGASQIEMNAQTHAQSVITDGISVDYHNKHEWAGIDLTLISPQLKNVKKDPHADIFREVVFQNGIVVDGVTHQPINTSGSIWKIDGNQVKKSAAMFYMRGDGKIFLSTISTPTAIEHIDFAMHPELEKWRSLDGMGKITIKNGVIQSISDDYTDTPPPQSFTTQIEDELSDNHIDTTPIQENLSGD